MLIECPNCGAQAEIAAEKRGSKVRCGACSKVYVGEPVARRRPATSRTKESQNQSKMIALAVGGFALVVIALIMARGGGDDAPPPPPEVVAAPPPKPVVETGWSSPQVLAARSAHDAAYAGNRVALLELIDLPSAWAWKQTASVDEAEGAEGASPADAAVAWISVEPLERAAFGERLLDELISGDAKDKVADWKPYDGKIIEESDNAAIVRLDVTPRGEGAEKRTIEWSLVRDGVRWKVATWKRYLTPEELLAAKIKRSRSIKKVTLSDGSVVIEGEGRVIEHYEDTAPELRKEIDSLYATLVDLEIKPREAAAAMRRLVEIGRPALPVLLTGMYLTPLETPDQALQLNMINQCLEQITGNYTGFKPQVAVGSGTGTSEERRQSAIKQWFGWYELKGKKFQERSNEDTLDDLLQPRNEREQWELEKAKRQSGGG